MDKTEIINLTEASGVSDNDYVMVDSPTQGVRKYKASNFIGGEPTLTTKSITANGTYEAVDDNAQGYSEVTVNVSDVGGTLPDGYSIKVDANDMYILGHASSMSAYFVNNMIRIVWGGGSDIANSVNGQILLNNTIRAGVSKLKYKFNATNSYEKGTASDLRPLIIGVSPNKYTGGVYTNITHNAGSNNIFSRCVDYRANDSNNFNKDIEGYVDLSNLNLTGDIYILVSCCGWTIDIKELSLE